MGVVNIDQPPVAENSNGVWELEVLSILVSEIFVAILSVHAAISKTGVLMNRQSDFCVEVFAATFTFMR